MSLTLDTLSQTTSQAQNMLPVRLAYEVFIDNKAIDPVLSINILQTNGAHHVVELQFFHDQIQPKGTVTIEEAQKLLGKLTEITIKNINDPNDKPFQAKFIICDIKFAQEDQNEGVLILTGYSPTLILDGAKHYESFYKKTLKEIAEIVCQPMKSLRTEVIAQPSYENSLPYVCRYNETAWNFLKRLSNQMGQWFYFNGKTLIFGKPDMSMPISLQYIKDCAAIELNMQLKPMLTNLADYNPVSDRPLNEPTNKLPNKISDYNDVVFTTSTKLFNSQATIQPSLLGPEDNILKLLGKAYTSSNAADMYVIRGESNNHHLRIGSVINITFTKAGKNISHSPMRIIYVNHHLTHDGEYTNTFEAIPSNANIPPTIYYNRPITNPMLAKVIKNNDPQNQGRVQVQFVGWEQKHSPQQTDWIRLLTLDGGGGEKVSNNRGFVFIPEIGDQVMVDFENGNPDRPFVIGSKFHGKTAGGGGEGNNVKGISTKSGNTITLNDKDGSITITDPKGAKVVMKGDGTLEITAPDKIDIKSKEINITAENKVAVGAKEVKVDGSNTADFISSAGTTTINSQTETTVKSKNIIKVGAPNVEAKADGPMKIAGANLDMQADKTATLKGNTMVAIN